MDNSAEKEAELRQQIDRIAATKDYYEILGVSQDAEGSDIKNAYRKLAMKIHPDKNNLKGAKQAFHKISNAYATLIDEQKRQFYDKYEIEDKPKENKPNTFQNSQQNDQKIFEQFFKGQKYGMQIHNPFNLGGLRILRYFLIAAICISLVKILLEKKPSYSLKYGGVYLKRRATSLMNTEYFVKNNDSPQYSQDQLKSIEKHIDLQFYYQVSRDCQLLTEKRKKTDESAKFISPEKRAENQRAYPATSSYDSCQKLKNLQERYSDYLQQIL